MPSQIFRTSSKSLSLQFLNILIFDIACRQSMLNFHQISPKLDIDVLTKSMNYVPVVAGTNSNDSIDGLLFDSSSKNDSNDEQQPSSDAGKKDDEGTRRMTKTSNEQGFISAVYEGKTYEDLHTSVQDELLQFKLQKVWTLVDLPYGKRAIRTKWVYKNKKYERVARIEAIRLFLAYASFKEFVVYQMDLKSAFLYRKIKEEVYVCQ
ncbi:putative ribonuclease H-like domain-containing protein [Tanacetum coccineum]